MSISLLSKVKIKKSKFTGNSNNPKSKIQNPKLPNHPMIVQRPLIGRTNQANGIALLQPRRFE
jgi:hypothetical protein